MTPDQRICWSFLFLRMIWDPYKRFLLQGADWQRRQEQHSEVQPRWDEAGAVCSFCAAYLQWRKGPQGWSVRSSARWILDSSWFRSVAFCCCCCCSYSRVISYWRSSLYSFFFLEKLLVIFDLSNCNPGLIAPPTDVNVIDVESRIATVQWTNPDDDPAMLSATSSKLRYSNQEGTSWDLNTPTLTTSHTLTGLTPYTNYTVKVLLADSAERGLWSPELEFTTDSEGQSANVQLVGHYSTYLTGVFRGSVG